MICFPLDNTEYGAEALGAYLCTRTRGVFSAEANLAVTAASGMSITVSPGLAWLKYAEYWGTCALQPQPLTLSIEVADGALARIDAVVCRLDKIQNRAEIIIKKGAYAASPTVVAPVRNDNYDEIYIATISVKAGTVALSAALITDQRLNETYCGLMRDGVTGIPTAMLQAQAQELIDQLRTVIAGIEQGSEVMLRTIYDPRGKATDIFAAIPGRDLLDNSYFINPVNQRGSASYSTDGYCIDRWALATGMVLNVANHTLTGSNTSNNSLLYQRLIGLTLGQTYTLSLKVNGEIVKATHQLGTDSTEVWETFSWGRVAVYKDGDVSTILIYVNNGTAITVDWVKLELGIVATPYVPKGYGAELAECMRYFYSTVGVWTRIVTQAQYNGALQLMGFFPVPMRTVPTITFDGTYQKNVSGATSNPFSNIGFNAITPIGYSGYIPTGEASVDFLLKYNYTASADL